MRAKLSAARAGRRSRRKSTRRSLWSRGWLSGVSRVARVLLAPNPAIHFPERRDGRGRFHRRATGSDPLWDGSWRLAACAAQAKKLPFYFSRFSLSATFYPDELL